MSRITALFWAVLWNRATNLLSVMHMALLSRRRVRHRRGLLRNFDGIPVENGVGGCGLLRIACLILADSSFPNHWSKSWLFCAARALSCTEGMADTQSDIAPDRRLHVNDGGRRIGKPLFHFRRILVEDRICGVGAHRKQAVDRPLDELEILRVVSTRSADPSAFTGSGSRFKISIRVRQYRTISSPLDPE